MNTKWIIGALVGGLIVFLWQFLSWSLINLHSSNQKYTPNQDAILEYLSTSLTEDGSYFLPNAPKDATDEERQKVMESSLGKPWVQISYHQSMQMNMGLNMVRGYAADVVAVFILCWLLSMMSTVNIKNAVMISVGIGLIGYLTTQYSNSIWFEINSMPDLIDAIVGWSLCGAWLGFWFKK
jgi:hypothetical protein